MPNTPQRWADQVEEIRGSKFSNDNQDTIFHGMLNSDLPEAEKNPYRMRQEAELLVQGGNDTTGNRCTCHPEQMI